MGRMSIRELFRFRNFILTHPSLIPSKPNLFSSIFSSEDRTNPVYHPILILLRTCQNTRQMFQIHAHLITSGLFQNSFWLTRVLKQSSDFGDIDYTNLIFRYIDSPGTFCINTVIKAYSISSVPHKALDFYFEMLRNGLCPNSYTFIPIFGSCAKMGCAKSGQMCHGQAIKNGVDCVLVVQNSLIHMYGCCGVIDFAHKVFVEISEWDLVSWNSIVNGFAKNGDLGVAHKLFDLMPERNVVSYNIMINGYLEGGNPGCALKLFRKMAKTGLRGNDTSMVGVLTACGRSARLKEGRSVHGSLVRTCLKWSTILSTALIDMYSKCQRVEVAQRVFNKIVYRNLVCWNAMILGHCIHGNPEDGLNLFAEMVGQTGSEDGESILPDEITYVGVLCACARAGLLTEGRNYFNQMIYTFSINPKFAHYWCMANLYAVAGLIQEAEEILRNMPEDKGEVSSETLVWANLLSSCRFQGDITLGEGIAKYLIDMEPQNFSYHRLLLNVYAVAGQWENVARVKEMIKKRMRRMPGCSLVDLNEIVHKLNVGHHGLGGEGEEGIEEVNEIIGKLSQRPSLLDTGWKHPPIHKTEAGS